MTTPTRCRICGKPVRLRADGTAGRHQDQSGHLCPGTALPPRGEPPCLPTCRPVGTIGYPVSPETGKTHASTMVCDSPSHQDEARAWVQAITGSAGVFRPFAQAWTVE